MGDSEHAEEPRGELLRVTQYSACGQALMRVCGDVSAADKSCLGDVLAVVAELKARLHELGMQRGSVSVLPVQGRREQWRARPFTVCNIVGKVEHYDVLAVFRPEIRPLVQVKSDTFGSTWCLYSVYGNLRVNAALSSTLFRGATSSANVLTLVRHAIIPETIRHVTMHMLVSMGHVGRPVATDNDVLLRALSHGNAWRCVADDVLEEMSMYRHFLLKGFDAAWLATLGVTAKIKSARLSVARSGFVSVFLSIAESPRLELCAGCEGQFDAFLAHVMAVLVAHT